MKKTSIIVLAILAAFSCKQEQQPGNTHTLTIRAGFEESNLESKTYIKDSNAGTIWWGTGSQDKVMFVFNQADQKYTFTSSSTQPEVVRSFECDSWGGGEWKIAVWTGSTAASDNCFLSGTVISGSSLAVMNPQTVTNSNSFNNTANIAVMKPEDSAMRNVLGYLRFSIPTYPGSTLAAIKSVQFTADEHVAGNISIDYSGADPVATITSNGTNTLTLNTRWKNTGYEAGVAYMVLPAGTYHNAKLTVTPFSETPSVENAATATPYTVYFNSDLTITRSRYTDCGTLAASDPNAFDYCLSPGDTHKASLASSRFASYGVSASSRDITGPILVDGITYGGPGMSYYGNRISCNKVNTEWSVDFPNVIPTSRCFSFKVSSPGTLRFYPALANKDGDNLRIPTFYLAVVKTVGGVTSASIVQSITPASAVDGTLTENRNDSNVYSAAYEQYWISMTVTEDDLEGIDEPATVCLYHRYTLGNTCGVYYWPLEWTVSY